MTIHSPWVLPARLGTRMALRFSDPFFSHAVNKEKESVWIEYITYTKAIEE